MILYCVFVVNNQFYYNKNMAFKYWTITGVCQNSYLNQPYIQPI